MDVDVMIERVNGNGYRATAMTPSPVVAEAPTRDEVLDRIRAMISERLAKAEWVRVTVPTAEDEMNPWLAIAGMWRDHPDIDKVEENIRAYRREIDADDERI
jgi:hypothetical protein